MTALTIVVPTFNRAAALEGALRALTAQRGSPPPEIVVVDNNSRDATRDTVRAFGSRVRYVFEPRQGLSHARNAGIDHATRNAGTPAREHVIAFTDDDVEVAPGWAAALVQAFEEHADVECVGGRVLPRWTSPPPLWLTRAHWAPLALQDHGDAPLTFDAGRPVCLVGANVAFRRSVFDRVGRFADHVQRVGDGIGSTEDHELLLRLYGVGGRARYAPGLLVWTDVPAERLRRAYHRRWHRGHGRFHAIMRTPEMERTARGRWLGVPAHLYGAAAKDLVAWARLAATGRAAAAFEHELRLWFFWGFFGERTGWTRSR